MWNKLTIYMPTYPPLCVWYSAARQWTLINTIKDTVMSQKIVTEQLRYFS